MFKKFVATAATVLVAAALSLTGVASTASATAPGGSDSPIPYTVTTTSLTLSSGFTFNSSSPTNDGNVKYIPISQYSPGQTWKNPGSSWTVTNINFHIEQNDGFGKSMIGKTTLPFDSAASGGAFRGTLPTSGYCIVWVQVDGYNEHFGEGGQTPLCTTTVTADASAAAPTISKATCATGQIVSLGSVTNASWGTLTGGTGPGSYSVTATASPGHTFPGGSTTKTFAGTLAGPLSSDDDSCKPAPVCIPNSAVSYTYSPTSNSGDITVRDITNSTGTLCHPFYVTATSWRYTTNAVWPQKRDVVEQLPEITAPGVYHFVATVTCGQGDIYASFTSSPQPTEDLYGPGNPYAEHFLHDMGFTGPNPTYVQQSTGCNVVTPVAPTATAITACGMYGSVSVPANTDSVSYAVTGTGNQGDYQVVATVNAPYTLASGAQTTWSFSLGNYVTCAVACSAINPGTVSTNLDPAGWTFTESKGSGAHTYVPSGLEVSTAVASPNDKSAGYIATDFPLSDVGDPSLSFSNTSGGAAPGLQLTVYVNGAFFGNLVNEPLFPKWWSSHAVAGLPAGPNPSYQLSYGSLNDYLYAWAQQGVTDVQVKAVGYSLGSGAKGDGIITGISADCVNYTFTSKSYQPTAAYTLGACYPNGDFSSKNLYFEFDNSQSDVPVTFSVAYTDISVVVPAHSTQQVEGTPIWDQGGGYDVYADGVLLTHLTIPAFLGCLTATPGDPTASPEVCTNGVVSNGSIFVDLQPGLSYSITGVGNDVSIPVVTTHETLLPQGTYTVAVTANPGFTLSGVDSWPFTLTVSAPVHCELVTPLEPKITTDLGCDVVGSYNVPAQNGVVWKVDGAVVLPGDYQVTSASVVDVTAAPVNSTWGFVSGATTEWKLAFTDPLGCDFPTLSVQPINVTSTPASCTADGSLQGTITVGQVDGVDFTQFVRYSIDGTPVSKVTTPVSSGTHVVTAVALGDNSLEAGPNTAPDAKSASWTVQISSAVIVCADLTTLALTGTDATGWIVLAVVMLQLGVALLAVRFALTRRRAGQHRAS